MARSGRVTVIADLPTNPSIGDEHVHPLPQGADGNDVAMRYRILVYVHKTCRHCKCVWDGWVFKYLVGDELKTRADCDDCIERVAARIRSYSRSPAPEPDRPTAGELQPVQQSQAGL